MARNMPPEGIDKNGVAKILDDLFVTKREERLEEDHSSRIPRTQEVEKQDLRVTEEDLRTAIARLVLLLKPERISVRSGRSGYEERF